MFIALFFCCCFFHVGFSVALRRPTKGDVVHSCTLYAGRHDFWTVPALSQQNLYSYQFRLVVQFRLSIALKRNLFNWFVLKSLICNNFQPDPGCMLSKKIGRSQACMQRRAGLWLPFSVFGEFGTIVYFGVCFGVCQWSLFFYRHSRESIHFIV